MAYEIFARKTIRTGSPVMSFSRIGQIAFNQSAARILQKEAVEFVLLMWDADENRITIKSTNNRKDRRAYRIRYADKGNGAGFSAKTFMDYAGLDYSERRSVPVEINTNSEIIIEAKLPDAFFGKKAQQPRIVERGKSA